jgi:3-oxoacyl-[acyl-carrier protein] reductase
MELNLKGKKAIVCGSTQGIGKAIAVELAAAGATLILVARNEEKLKQVISELKVTARQSHGYIVADFSQPEVLKKKIETYIKDIDTIHILINNTGGPSAGPVLDADVSEFSEAFSKHVLCNQILAQAVIPLMKKSGYGRIINIISTSVKEPITGLGVSNTIRGAVASWSKTLSGEVAKYGITVNNILPGYTKTSRLESLIELKSKQAGKTISEIEKEMLQQIPAGRFADTEELAAVALFIASPLSAYVTGVNIPVDGGKTKAI